MSVIASGGRLGERKAHVSKLSVPISLVRGGGGIVNGYRHSLCFMSCPFRALVAELSISTGEGEMYTILHVKHRPHSECGSKFRDHLAVPSSLRKSRLVSVADMFLTDDEHHMSSVAFWKAEFRLSFGTSIMADWQEHTGVLGWVARAQVCVSVSVCVYVCMCARVCERVHIC